MTVNPEPLQKCMHSLGKQMWINSKEQRVHFPCVLDAHLTEDVKGRPIHQDTLGRQWS